MPELLVKVKSQANHNDPYLNCALSKRGDVITWLPDGANWGKFPLIEAWVRILKMPHETADTCNAMLTPELPVDPSHPSKTLQYRGFYLNLDSSIIPTDMAAYLADDTRAVANFLVPDTITISLLKLQRLPISDPPPAI